MYTTTMRACTHTHIYIRSSTWLLVDCADCAEVATVSVSCTSTDDTTLTSGDGGSGSFSLAGIIGIAVGGLVVLLCLGFCFSRHKKRGRKGSQTFDDSEHAANQSSQKVAGGVGGAIGGGGVAIMRGDSGSTSGRGSGAGGVNSKGPIPSYATAVGDTIESPLGGGGGVGRGGSAGSIDRGLIGNGKSFKQNHAGGSTPAYEGIFASRPGSGGGSGGGGIRPAPGPSMAHRPAVEMSKYAGPRADSMAAAAVAASATARPQGGGAGDTPEAFAAVLSSGVVEGGPGGAPQQQQAARGRATAGAAGAGGITWSAGQNLGQRGGYDDEDISDYGDDSAAGSVYDLQPPTEALEHRYNTCDDSVAASSPGAYSMYSHYTAGGGGVPYARGGRESGEWSTSTGGDSPRPNEDGMGAGGGGGGEGARGAGRRAAKRVPSPAGLVGRHVQRSGASPPPPPGVEDYR